MILIFKNCWFYHVTYILGSLCLKFQGIILYFAKNISFFLGKGTSTPPQNIHFFTPLPQDRVKDKNMYL